MMNIILQITITEILKQVGVEINQMNKMNQLHFTDCGAGINT